MDQRFRGILVLLLLTIFITGIIDFFYDASLHRTPGHLFFELAFIVLCLVTALFLGVGWYRERRELTGVRVALGRQRAESDAWREQAAELMRGVGAAIETQLSAWELTAAERDTALLLLKGYSHKEIAALSERSERTVRQHAVAVYRKSGLHGRAELSAYFLEDLLPPVDARDASPV